MGVRTMPYTEAAGKPQFAGMGSGGSGGGGSYTLPTATASRLGGVKIGSGVSVSDDGTISVEGGGSGDLGTVTVLTGTLNAPGEHTIKQNVTSYDWVMGYVKASYSGDSDYWLPVGYQEGSDKVNVRLQGTKFKILFASSGATNISYKVFVGNLVATE